jgi:hypothetical protein
MPRSLAIPAAGVAALALASTAAPSAKPCSGEAAAALQELLPRVRLALDLAGTDEVGLDPSGRCIGVQVRTRGTARLVKLLLRGVDVPREAVDLRVVEVQPAGGA